MLSELDTYELDALLGFGKKDNVKKASNQKFIYKEPVSDIIMEYEPKPFYVRKFYQTYARELDLPDNARICM